jgi:putative ABC transport system permease protein
MWNVTIKGLLAEKLRLVLTSVAVVLGVAFISGTFVLTDTLGSVFDNLFSETTKGVDAVVRSRRALDTNDQRMQSRNPVPESLVPVVERAPGVRMAHGAVQGYAAIVGKDGDTVGSTGRTSGFAWLPRPFGQANHIIRGHAPRAAKEMVLDEGLADRAVQHDPQPPLRDVVARGRHRAHRHRQHARVVDLRTDT